MTIYTFYSKINLKFYAKRFGGRYAKKVPVTAKDSGDVYLERAEEMDIVR